LSPNLFATFRSLSDQNERDDAIELTAVVGDVLADTRSGKNGLEPDEQLVVAIRNQLEKPTFYRLVNIQL